ncbi:MAG: HNH endonuclease signature motif containing protein [Dehalococcoidales bacterium]|nr:HNH endonuclease signature motif containing protein [Dehalococcoidales bacterium]
MANCIAPGCTEKIHARSFCNKHLHRFNRGKSLTEKSVREKTLKERFFDKVHKRGENDCWEWKANKNHGYGQFRINVKQIKAHRVSYELHHGKIDPTLCVLHHCDNRGCVNPKHLYQGTYQDNTDDRMRRGRHGFGVCPGEKHGMAKLTEDKVRKIRGMYIPRKITQLMLSKKFGVSGSLIHNIVTRKAWNHI